MSPTSYRTAPPRVNLLCAEYTINEAMESSLCKRERMVYNKNMKKKEEHFVFSLWAIATGLPALFALHLWQKSHAIYTHADDVIYWMQSYLHYLSLKTKGFGAITEIYLSQLWDRPSIQQLLGVPFLFLSGGDVVKATHLAMLFFYFLLGAVLFLNFEKWSKNKFASTLASLFFLLHPFVFSSAQKFLTELPFLTFLACAVYFRTGGKLYFYTAAAGLALCIRPLEGLQLLIAALFFEILFYRGKNLIQTFKNFCLPLIFSLFWFLPRLQGLQHWYGGVTLGEKLNFGQALAYAGKVSWEFLGPLGVLWALMSLIVSIQKKNSREQRENFWYWSLFCVSIILFSALIAHPVALEEYHRHFLYLFFCFFLASFALLSSAFFGKKKFILPGFFSLLLLAEITCYFPHFRWHSWYSEKKENVKGFIDRKLPVLLVDELVAWLPAKNKSKILLWARSSQEESPWVKMRLRALESNKEWYFTVWGWPGYKYLYENSPAPDTDATLFKEMESEFDYVILGPVPKGSKHVRSGKKIPGFNLVKKFSLREETEEFEFSLLERIMDKSTRKNQ